MEEESRMGIEAVGDDEVGWYRRRRPSRGFVLLKHVFAIL
jgi:hypothetical protein